ncbi:hypothetical protein LFT48_21690 (plasmid) [Arthrobacter sp. FW305-123]|nr:hypothetical protein LFT48_21690 [Arthrobacter sp. FW305-123]
MPIEQLLLTASTTILGLISLVLAMRSWIYGGSVIRVDMELCRRDSMGGLITGSVATWRQGGIDAVLPVSGNAQVDLVKVTVRNLGRTAATIHDVGLRGGKTPIPLRQWTARPNQFSQPGEMAEPLRVEAHDVKVFYFHSIPVLRTARRRFGDRPLAFRASVMTGTGKERLSRCLKGRKWNVWAVKEPGDRSITGELLTTREQARLWVELTDQIYKPEFLWVRQAADHAAELVDQGFEAEEAYEKMTERIRIFGVAEDDHRWQSFAHALLWDLIKLRTEAAASTRSVPQPPT